MKLEPVESVVKCHKGGFDMECTEPVSSYQGRKVYQNIHSAVSDDRKATHKAVVELLEGQIKALERESKHLDEKGKIECFQRILALKDAIQEVDELFGVSK